MVTAPALAAGSLQVRVAASGAANWTQGPAGTFTSTSGVSIAGSGGTLALPLEVQSTDGCNAVNQKIEWGFTYTNFCNGQATGQPAITQVTLTNVPSLAGGLTLIGGVDSQRLVVGTQATVRVAAGWTNAFSGVPRIDAGTVVITLPTRLQLTNFTPPSDVVVNGQVVTWTIPAPTTANGSATPLDLPVTLLADSDPCASGGVALNVTQTFTAPLAGGGCIVAAPSSSARIIVLAETTVPSETNEVVIDGTPAADGRWETGAADDGDAIRERATQGEGEFIPWKSTFFFGATATVPWTELMYYDDYTADLRQTLVGPVTVQVTNLGNSGTSTYTIPDTDVSSDPITGLSVNLQSLQNQPNAGSTLAEHSVVIRYQTTVLDPADASIDKLDRQLQRVRVVYGTGGACGAAERAVATDLAVSRGRASIAVDVPNQVDDGVPFTATMTVTAGPFSVFNPAVTPNFSPYTLVAGSEIYSGAFAGRIQPSNGAYVMTEPGGALPDSANPAELAANASGTITVTLIRPRSATGDVFAATVAYGTAQTRQAAASRIYDATASDRPTFVRKAVLGLDASPATVTVLSRDVTWSFYASNLGNGDLPGLVARIAAPTSGGQPALTLSTSSPISVTGPTGLTASDLQLTLVSGNLQLSLVNPAATLVPGQQVRVQVRGTPTSTAVWPLGASLIDSNWGASTVDDPSRQRLSVAFQQATRRVQTGVIRSGDPIGAGTETSTADMLPASETSTGVVYAFVRNTGQTALYQTVFGVDLDRLSNASGLTWDSSRAIRFKLRENGVWSGWNTDATNPTAAGSTVTWTGTTPEVAIGSADTVAKALSRLDPPDNGKRSAVLVEIPVKASELAADQDPTARATATVQAPLPATVVPPVSGDGTVLIRKPTITLAVDGRNITTGSAFSTVVRADTGNQIEWRVRVTNTSSDVSAYNLFDQWIMPTSATLSWTGVTITAPGGVATPVGDGNISPSNPTISTAAAIPSLAPGTTITYLITGLIAGGDNRTATASSAWGTDLTPDFADPDLSKTETAIVSLVSLPRLTLSQVATQLDNGRAKVVCTVSNDGQRADQLAFTVTPPPGMTWDGVAPTLGGSGGLSGVSRAGNVITASGTLASFDDPTSGIKTNTITWWWRPTITDDVDDDTQIPETSADPATRPGGSQPVSLAYRSPSTLQSYTATNSVTVDPATPDLDFSVPAPAFVTAGQEINIPFTVTNSGEANSQARFATLTLEAPGSGLNILGVTPPGGSEITTGLSYPFDIPLATLAQGQTAVLTVKVQIVDGNPYTLRAAISHRVSEGGDAGNTAGTELQGRDAARARIAGFTLATTLAGTSSADSAGADLLIGEQLQPAINATWFGLDPARPVSNIAITATLPTGAADVQSDSGTVTGGTLVTWNPTTTSAFTRTPAWRTTRTASNHVRGAKLNTVANGSFTYLGVTWNSSTSGFPSSALRTVTATVREPALALARAASPTGAAGTFTPNLIVTPGAAGTAPTVRVELRNPDAVAPLYAATTSEALPTGYELSGQPTLPAGWTATLSGRNLIITAGTLVPGASGVATYQLTPTAAVAVGTTATTRGSASGTSLPDQPSYRKTYSLNKDVTLSAPRVDLLTADDTGISSTDDLTANARPRITFSPAPSDLASVVYTFRGPGGATVTATGTTISGGWQGRPGTALGPDGAWTVTVTGTDAVGNAFASDALPFTLDTTPPEPTAVAAPSTADGFYKAGAAIPLELTVTEPIPAGRSVTATLSSGGTVLLTSDGTTTLRGTYTVAAGQNTPDLDIASLRLSSGAAEPIDAAGNALDVSALPTPNLAASRAIVIDTIAPVVTRIEAQPSSGFFKAGSAITLSITTSEPILAGQTITVTLDTGATVTFTGDGTSTTLSAVYTVSAGENSADLTVTKIAGNGTDRAGNPLSTTLPSGQNLGDTAQVVVDTTPPAAPAVTSIGDDTGISGSDQVTSDQTWTVGGTAEPFASIAVRIDGTAAGIATTGADGRWSLVVPATQAEGTHAIDAVATDRAGNAGPRSTPLAVTVDRTPPTITRIRSTSADGFYTVGARLALVVEVSEPVYGPVLVTLDTGDVITFTGTGSTTLTAEYVVSAGDTSADLAVTAISTTATDRAGNGLGTTVPAGQSLADLAQLVIDTTAPLAPVITGISDDTGISGSDGITSDNTLLIRGTGEVGTTVTVRIDGAVAGTALVAANGTWVLDRTATTLAGGAHTITATTKDLAGNVSPAATPFPVVVDRTAPAVVRLTSDTPNGSYTVGSTLTLRLTLSEAIPAGQSVSVTLDTGAVVVFVGDGTSTQLTAAYTVAVGQTSTDVRATAITSSATDVAGNALVTTIPPGGNLDANADLRIDTTAPAKPVIAGISDDTGISTSDAITRDNSLTVNGTAEPNSTVRVLIDGTVRATVTADGGGAWSVALPAALADGTYAFTATATDGANNVSTTAAPSAVIVDTVAPTLQAVSAATPAGTYAAGSALTLLATFSEPLPAGAVATLTLNNGRTVTVTGDGTALTLPATLVVATGDDTPDLVVTGVTGPATDVAGNPLATTVFVPALDPGSLAIDTTLPNAPVISAISPDTGVAGDFITSNRRPAISGTGEPGTTLTLSADGAVIGTVVVAANGSWTITPTSDLAEGPRALAAVARDAAGNDSPVATRSLVIDAIPPRVTAFAAGVTGTIGTSGTVPLSATLSEAVAPGGSITVQLNTGALVTLTNPGPGYSTVLSGTYTVRPGDLSATLQVVSYGATNVLDAAGNRLTTTTMPVANLTGVAVDGVPPAAPAQPDLRAAQDSGSSQTDNVTNITAPTLDLPGVPADAVAVSVIVVPESGGSPLTLTATFSSGVWSVALPPRSDGAWLISAIARDAAGNASAPSPGLRLVIDTTPPATFLAPDLAASSDTGASSSDNLTSDTTPRITLVGVPADAESATVTLTSSAGPTQTLAAVRDANGRWTVDVTTALADGVWSVTAQGTDAAGNVGSASPALAITVLTTAPLPPAVPDLVASSDSGYLDSDDITNVTSPTFIIPGVPSAVAVVKVRLTAPDGTVRILTAQNNAGVWSATVPSNRPLEDGLWSLVAVAQDVVGNVSPEGPALALRIDTVAPRAIAFTTSPASGVTFSLGEQVPLTLTYDEAVAPRSTAVLRLDTGASVVVANQGSTYASTLTGTYVVGSGENSADLGVTGFTSQVAVDAAGNVASGDAFTGVDNTTVEIDTRPVATLDGPDLAASSDTGRSDQDDITADTTPTLVATSTDADSVSFTLTLGATVITVPATSDGAGTWSATVPGNQALADGVWQVEVTAVRLAVSTTVGPLAITIDTQPPSDPGTPDLLAFTDTGVSSNDNITASVRPTFAIPSVPGDATAVYLILQPDDGSAPIRVPAIDLGGNTWVARPTTDLPDGTYTVLAAAQAEDAAGNSSSPSTGITITIDTVPPAAPDAPLLVSDSGTLGDGTTKVVRPTVSVLAPADAVNVAISFSNGTDVYLVPATLVAGTWQATPPQDLSEGSWTVTAEASDLAGNISPVSQPATIVIDTTAELPQAPVLASASDTGESGDMITQLSQPTMLIPGVPADAVAVQVTFTPLSGGSAVQATATLVNGVWQVVPTSALADGGYSVTAVLTDAAGNVGAPSPAGALTVDTTPPSAPSAPVLVAASDSGIIGDSVTNVQRPLLVVPGVPADAVAVTVTVIGPGGPFTVNATQIAGVWVVLPPATLAEGGWSVVATATDAAGNVSVPSTTGTFTIDRTGPRIIAVDVVQPDAAYPAGTALTIQVTTNEPLAPGQVLTFTLDTGTLLTVIGDGASTTLSAIYTVSDGQNSEDLTIVAVAGEGSDAAGNPVETTVPPGGNLADRRAVVIDTTAPLLGVNPLTVGPGGGVLTGTRSEDLTALTVVVAGRTYTLADAELTLVPGGWRLVLPGGRVTAPGSSVAVLGRDRAGNPGTATGTILWDGIVATSGLTLRLIGEVTPDTLSLTVGGAPITSAVIERGVYRIELPAPPAPTVLTLRFNLVDGTSRFRQVKVGVQPNGSN